MENNLKFHFHAPTEPAITTTRGRKLALLLILKLMTALCVFPNATFAAGLTK